MTAYWKFARWTAARSVSTARSTASALSCSKAASRFVDQADLRKCLPQKASITSDAASIATARARTYTSKTGIVLGSGPPIVRTSITSAAAARTSAASLSVSSQFAYAPRARLTAVEQARLSRATPALSGGGQPRSRRSNLFASMSTTPVHVGSLTASCASPRSRSRPCVCATSCIPRVRERSRRAASWALPSPPRAVPRA
mmetsp:Transcript_29808/g.74997  ORF Transcript_29808/g.74997 Transcript_29808/m.74997 type:complete len:201 (+) Transcript_29808:771-1373(+)